MTRSAISAAALALTLLGSAAAAQTATMTVKVGDLNTSSDAGAQSALRRIHYAADIFCGGADSRELSVMLAQQKCVARMTDKAVTSLNAPKVSALNGATPRIVLAAGVR